MAIGYSPKIRTNALVQHFDAANPKSYPGSGSIWYDLCDNADMSLSGSYGFNGSAITFDGATATGSATSQIANHRYNWTIEVAAYRNTTTTSQVIICPSNAGIDQSFRFGSSNCNAGFVRIADNNSVTVNCTATIGVAETYVMTLVRTPHRIRLYVDGVLDQNVSWTTSTAEWAGNWSYGQRGNSTSYLNGGISSVKVWKAPLDSDEVYKSARALLSRFK